jgi:hypothetical protein
MFNWNKQEIDALSGRFVSSSILNFILNNTINKLTYTTNLIQWNTYIFRNTNIDKIKEVQDIMVNRALEFQKRSKKMDTPMIIYWFPTDYKKEIPKDKKSLDVNEINSACTFHIPGNQFIALYRFEEAPKVLYHELIHYFNLDDIIPFGEDIEYKNRFNLKSPCLLRETYCEIIALLLNIEDVSKRENKNFMDLYNIEYAFSILQKDKILNFFDIKDENGFNKLVSDTNVFTYFILKTAILLTIKDPLIFLKQMENNNFKLHSIQFLKSIINSGLELLFKEKVFINIPYFNNTLRMTIIE